MPRIFSGMSIMKRLITGFGAIALILVGSTVATAIANGAQGSEIFVDLGIVVIDLLLAGAIAYFTVRSITGPLASMSEAIGRIANGEANVEIPGIDRTDEFGVLARHIQAIKERGFGFQRIKVALDRCTTNVMVADDNYNIVYLNESLGKMLGEVETELRQELPQFDSKKLISANIDIFHKNPAHQRRLLDGLVKPYQTTLHIGDLIFDLIATPVFDDEGARIGTVVEWADRTHEDKREREMKKAFEDNMRIKVALDNCTTNVMVADNNFNIVYIWSEASSALMREWFLANMRNGVAADDQKVDGSFFDGSSATLPRYNRLYSTPQPASLSPHPVREPRGSAPTRPSP